MTVQRQHTAARHSNRDTPADRATADGGDSGDAAGPGTRSRWRAWYRDVRAWLVREYVAVTLPAPRAAGDRRWVVALFVVGAAVFTLAARLRILHGSPAGDEPAYLVISQTLQKYHSVDVMRDYDNRDYWSFYPAPLAPHVVPGPDGRELPLHNIGGPLLWLVPFMLWGRAGALGFIVVVSALLVANLYKFLRERRIQPGYAVLTTALFAVGSPIYLYASMNFVEPIGALVILYATRVLLAHRPHPVRIAVAATGLAYAPWIHVRLAVFSLLLGTLLAGRFALDRIRPRPVPLACALGPLVLGAVALEVYGITTLGTANPVINMSAAGAGPFQVPLRDGILGTLFDRQVGLIPNFPLFLLVLPGVLLTLRRGYWLLHGVLFAVVVPYSVLVCTFAGWWGGYSPPARYVSVFLPLFGWYVAAALQRVRSVTLDTVAVVAGIVGYVLAVYTDLHADDRFPLLVGRNFAMDAVGDALGLPFARYVPSLLTTASDPKSWVWVSATIAVGTAVYLAGRPWSRAPARHTAPVAHPELAVSPPDPGRAPA